MGPRFPLAARTFQHTLTTSYPIPTHDGPTEPFELRDTDLALVRLDEPVPHPIGLPARLPAYAGECGSELFFGRLVGFSPNGYEQPADFAPGPGGETLFTCQGEDGGWRRRRSPSLLSWTRLDVGDAAVFAHLFVSPPGDPCSGLRGIGTGGDSGGSLYRIGGEPLLCGVISGDGPQNTEGGYADGFESEYHTSAVDHIANLRWIWKGEKWDGEKNHDGIFDDDGFLEDTYEPRGDCPDEFTLDPPLGCDDPDFDGIASLFDNCPRVFNPEQLTTHDDPEDDGSGNFLGDGIGEACDACPAALGGNTNAIHNLNREVEALLADGLVEPIHPDLFDSLGQFEAAKIAWREAFRPNTCDPTPVPLQELRDQGELPITYPPVPPTCLLQEECSLEVRNRIRIDGRTPIPLPPGTSATLGLRFCDCKDVDGVSTSTVEGRRRCAQDACSYNPAAYGMNPASTPWKPIRTPVRGPGGEDTWVGATDGREWTHPPDEDIDVFWDFTTLGPAVVSTAASQAVEGILWATYRTVTGFPATHVEAYAASLGTGDASWRYQGSGAPTYESIQDWIWCPSCPMALQSPLATQGNPDWRVTIENGSMPLSSPDEATRSYYEEVLRGELIHVAMSEPFTTVARAFSPDATFVRSVGVRDGAIASFLTSTGLEGVPSARRKVAVDETTSLAAAASPPSAMEGRGWAFSATKQRLYALGGLDGAGQPLNEGFKYDFASGTWRHYELPADEAVGAVLAAVYRFEDQAVYILDRDGPRIRLRRWNAQRRMSSGAVQTLAEMGAPWGALTRYALVAGERGDLALVGWDGPGRRKTRYARFHVDAAGHASMASVFLHGDPIASAPRLADGGLYVVLAPPAGAQGAARTPRGAHLPFTSFTSPKPADAPTILPH